MTPRRETLTYPVTKTVDQTDDYHGTIVADPYRWLEDLDSPETAAWVEEQNALTFGYLARIPYRDRIRGRLEALWDFDKFGVPSVHGGRYFYTLQTGLQNQPIVYVADSLDAAPRALLDPNTWSDDGTVAMVGAAPSDDGRLFAYGVSSGGSDWMEWRVVDTDTGEVLDDHLRWIKFSTAAWTPDGKGFFYSRYPADDGARDLEDANYGHQLHYHRIGTPQDADELVYERADHPDWLFAPSVSEDGRWLVITVFRGSESKNAVFVRDLSEQGAEIRPLIEAFEAQWAFLGSDGDTMWFQTDADAPRGRVVALDARGGAPAELVPEGSDALQATSLVGDRFLCHYLKDARSIVKVFALDGTFERHVDLPGIGSVLGLGGKRTDAETFFMFTSFTVPPEIHRYEVATGVTTLWRRPPLGYDPDRYETRQLFYRSPDGTTIPMFVTARRDIALDGSNPTILYGYGGFSVPTTPAYAVSVIGWLELGGVYAVACLRGGSEYGEDWHLAGTKERKQNVFDDFIAGAEHLIAEGWTTSERLAIYGGSNGGLLVGACITQRPDLFGAARIAVGVLDMLRFHRFTIGWAWASDYGTSDDPDAFRYLHAYSPLHNVRPGTCYPATLITTADHDDRVVPSHSFKFASTLQPAQGCDRPVLIRVDVRAGHGMGKPTAKLIEEAADAWSFLAWNLGLDDVPV